MNRIRDRLLNFLRAHTVITLAVTLDDGTPHAAALFYAIDDGLRMYVLSDPGTQHGLTMRKRETVAGTVQADNQDWKTLTGIQCRGRCFLLMGPVRAKAWKLYTERFPFLRQENPALAAAIARNELWCIELDWIRLIDNSRGFGHKDEWKRRGAALGLGCKPGRSRYSSAGQGVKRRSP